MAPAGTYQAVAPLSVLKMSGCGAVDVAWRLTSGLAGTAPTVRGIGVGCRGRGRPVEGVDLLGLMRVDVPQPHRPINTRTSQETTIRTDGDVGDLVSVAASSCAIFWLVCRSHSRTVLSCPAVASSRPSGLKAILSTAP